MLGQHRFINLLILICKENQIESQLKKTKHHTLGTCEADLLFGVEEFHHFLATQRDNVDEQPSNDKFVAWFKRINALQILAIGVDPCIRDERTEPAYFQNSVFVD